MYNQKVVTTQLHNDAINVDDACGSCAWLYATPGSGGNLSNECYICKEFSPVEVTTTYNYFDLFVILTIFFMPLIVWKIFRRRKRIRIG